MKRVLDLLIALVLLLVFAPVMVMLALAIKLSSRGPVVYRGRRVGREGSEFAMFKFRKMHHGVEGPALSSDGDDRYTRLGSFLARMKLDELPQLFNVVRGEMSLVGPRPEDPSFVVRYPREYAEILRATPGITGLSQLAFAKEGRLLERPDRVGYYIERLLPQKIAIDRFYVGNRSIGMDLRILAWTIVTVLWQIEVAVDRRSGRLSVRRRPKQRVPFTATEPEADAPSAASDG